MANITAADIKKLREVSGAGMSDVKKALVDTDGDMDKALAFLREKGLAGVAKRSGRSADNGMVHSYLHRSNPDLPPTVGVLVEVNCETDFVAKNEHFQSLAKDLALHIASADPSYVSKDEVPGEILESERKIYAAAAREEGKPEQAIDKIVEGRLSGYYKSVCLLEQPFVKDNKKTITNLLDEASALLGEKLAVRRFARFRVGQS
ncbi:MAG: translation elongation factor Ts [Actinomycetota bacterium]|nr:translation elongation factor Ts [Actinomycetota bacterium]